MKTVWILGAGASKSASGGAYPTLVELPRTAKNLGVVVEPPAGSGGNFDALDTFLRRIYGYGLSAEKPIDLEVVLTLLDIESTLENTGLLQSARSQLIRLIQRTFGRLQKQADASASEYEQVLTHVEKSDTIITFNWDVLLDDALGRMALLKDLAAKTPKAHYAAFLRDFTARGDSSVDKLSMPQPFSRWRASQGYYLKLHGSIDWAICTAPECRNRGRVFPLARSSTRPSCGYCLDRLQWMIVPPTLNKRVLDLGFVRRLWNVAAREIARAERLVIWGYSLPPTDFYSAWLFSKARRARLQEVVIINPAVVTGVRKVGFSRMFVSRFVEATKLDLAATKLSAYVSFADWAAGTPIEKRHPAVKKSFARLREGA